MEGSLVENNRYSVVIADDRPLVRRMVVRALERSKCFTAVAEAKDGRSAVAAVDEHQPDVLLLDLSMPGSGGLEVIPEIRASSPKTFVVVLSGIGPALLGAAALEAGAHLHLEKTSPMEDVIDALLTGMAMTEKERVGTL